MASKQPWECFVCKSNGFAGTMVYLAGKDEQGRAIRLEADGSPHIHKSKAPSQQQQQQQREPTIADVLMQIKLLHQKVDKLLLLQEKDKTRISR
jgi:hypothetical protein